MKVTRISDPKQVESQLTELVHRMYAGLPTPLLRSKCAVADEFDHAWVVTDHGDIAGVAVLYRNALIWEERNALLFGNLEFAALEAGQALVKHIIQSARDVSAISIIGPLNGNTWNDYRLSLMGAVPAFPGEPFNPQAYIDLLKTSGFDILKTYGSGLDESLGFQEDELSALHRELQAQGLRFHTLDKDHLEQELRLVHALCSKAFTKNFLYTPISWEAFFAKYQNLLAFVETRFSTLAMQGGHLAAFMFAYPSPMDISGKTLVIKTVARDPDRSPPGLGKYLVGLTTQMASQSGMERMVHALMPDESHSNIISQFYSGTPYRHYELLHMQLYA